MPTFADFYFYKNTPMDANEVNFFNTGGTNKDMADELLRRLREYQVGVEYNSEVPFNPTATEIYVNAFPGVSIEINEILSVDYMIVKAYDLHNRVNQEYKYFAYFVESIEPYMQTFPTDGLEDTGVKAAFGYSYRVKLKKDTFVTDFIFATAKISLSDIFTDGLRVNVATPTINFLFDNTIRGKPINGTRYSIEYYDNSNITTVIQRKKQEKNRKILGDTGNIIKKIKLFDDISSLKFRLVATYKLQLVRNTNVSEIATFSTDKDIWGNNEPNGTPIEEIGRFAKMYQSVEKIRIKTTIGSSTANDDYFCELQSLCMVPSTWVDMIDVKNTGGTTTPYTKPSDIHIYLLGRDDSEGIEIFQWDKNISTLLTGFSIPPIDSNGLEATNVTFVAGRQRIEMPQYIVEFVNGKIKLNTGTYNADIYCKTNKYGLSIVVNVQGKFLDVTSEFMLPVSTSASNERTQVQIAKTSSILQGVLSIIGGTTAAVGGFATGNVGVGVAGVSAVVGGATNIARGVETKEEPGAISFSGGEADPISMALEGVFSFEIVPCENAVEILNGSQRYGYNFNGMHILNGAESIFSAAESANYNFLYIEATAERLFDPTNAFSKNFKAWLSERMRNGIRIFYRFDDFFDKNRNQIGYLKV